MTFTTAFQSFSIIAIKKQFLKAADVARVENEFLARSARGQSPSFYMLFVELGLLNEEEVKRVLTSRETQARHCKECLRKTYLLKGQRSSELCCEFCGGALLKGRVDTGSRRLKALNKVCARIDGDFDPGLYIQAARLALELNRIEEARSYLIEVLTAMPGYKPAQELIEEFLGPFTMPPGAMSYQRSA